MITIIENKLGRKFTNPIKANFAGEKTQFNSITAYPLVAGKILNKRGKEKYKVNTKTTIRIIAIILNINSNCFSGEKI